MNNGHGYSVTRQKSESIASALREAALLMGEPQSTPVVLDGGATLLPGLGLVNDAAILTRRAKDLHEGLFKVLVYGEFKHGKSTLLNAMLGSRLLPAKTLKCTAIITVLVYGDANEVAVYEVGSEHPRLLGREEFAHTFQLTAADEETLNDQGYVNRFKDIAYAQVECGSQLCANGVRLVDSPGLGDHPSRTRVTTTYLRESNAIIFVLNAMRLLSDDEKLFIKREFKPGRMEHVFFVVNRINQINQREVEEVRQYFRNFLTPYFANGAGTFDEELYHRRVFFVNALGALDTRLAPAPDWGILEETGVLRLERELEQFLTSDQKHVAALAESAQCLDVVVAEALRHIEQQRALQDVPLERFEQGVREAEQHLQKLERKKRELERTVQRFGDTISQKIIADLRSYMHEMQDTWREDAQSMDLNEVSFGTILAAFFQGLLDKDAAHERIAAPIKREVEKYIQHKTREWAERRIPAHIRADIDTLVKEVEEQVIDFKLELERIGLIITPDFVPDPQQDRERFSQWAQTLIADTLHDITGPEGAISEWGDWGGVLWRIIQQLLLLYVVVTFSGPVGWTIFAVAQIVQFIWTDQQFRQRLLQKIGAELHKNLQQELPTMQHQIARDVAQQFLRLAHSLTTALQGQVDEKRQELARVMEQKRDLHFSAEQEKQRLTRIGARLVALRDEALAVAAAR